jgi:pyruvate/2-oxoacid:ferredoxin oxidoreductase alpha subunit
MVAYGTSARIVKESLETARTQGIKAGMLRPISLWPFPTERLRQLAARINSVLVVEMSSGQMLQDVQLAVNGQVPVHFEGRMGGAVPTEAAVLAHLLKLNHKPVNASTLPQPQPNPCATGRNRLPAQQRISAPVAGTA